jgi:plasmid stabilization system protein ParE
MIVEYHPAVERELEEARNFYENRVPGLGSEFIDEFERQVLRIAANPGRWMVLKRDVRRSLMNRFPYVIFFRQPTPDQIRILVVKHQRRHPAYGQDRT